MNRNAPLQNNTHLYKLG